MSRTGTGLCDSRSVLDRKTEEVRLPLQTWFNVRAVRDRSAPVDDQRHQRTTDPTSTANTEHHWVQQFYSSAEDGIIMEFTEQSEPGLAVERYEQEAMMSHLHGLQLTPPLRHLVPELLRVEMSLAMEKLGLLYDRSYAWDVFSDMMRSQLHLTLHSADLPKPFTETTRAILVDWLIQVHEVFNFSEETLYLAVHLLNRVLRLVKVSINSLQLLGIVCLFLAAKKEECLLPEVSELCYLMANTYSKKQLLRMERRVLCALRFELSYTSPIHFLLLTAYIGHCSEKVICMARYLLELSLLEAECVCFYPVQLAAAAVRLARRLLPEPQTPESEMSWYVASAIHLGSEASLFPIMRIMVTAASRAHSRETRATYVKFSTMETVCVSLHPGLKNASGLLGLRK